MSWAPRPWPENAEPTVEHLADWLAVCPRDERIERVRWWRHQASLALRCLEQDHRRRLETFDLTPGPGPGRHRAPDADPR